MKGGSIFDKLRHLTTKAQCARKGCSSGARATQIPVVTVWRNAEKTQEPANLVLSVLRVCQPCAAVMKVEDLITPQLQKQITASFQKSVTDVPCWETAELRWRDR